MRGEAGDFVTQTFGWNGRHLLSTQWGNPKQGPTKGETNPHFFLGEDQIYVGLSPFPVIVEMKVYRDPLLKM